MSSQFHVPDSKRAHLCISQYLFLLDNFSHFSEYSASIVKMKYITIQFILQVGCMNLSGGFFDQNFKANADSF